MSTYSFEKLLHPTPAGLYCPPADLYIDPVRPVERALITHGHGDHARRGHGSVLATPETIAIMRVRYGQDCAGSFEAMAYGERRGIGGVEFSLHPAGHILGSAQVLAEWRGMRAVVSGDYKRTADPTCAPFELVRCHLFITEATFGLPVFRHEPADREARRLMRSMVEQPARTHMLGVYGLGKCQRMIRLLRDAGYDRPIHLHGALVALSELYRTLGVELGDLRPVSQGGKQDFAGELVMCPPSSIADRWTRRFADPVTAFASGWMRVKGRVRQRGVELPLVVSDHVDWPELILTVAETEAEEVWVTHGREDALVHHLTTMGLRARALALVGFEEEGE